MSPIIFYNLTYNEARLILEGYESEQKHLYYLNYYATFNAIGHFLGGSKHKKFKPIDPFNTEKQVNESNKITPDQKQEIIDMFNNYKK